MGLFLCMCVFSLSLSLVTDSKVAGKVLCCPAVVSTAATTRFLFRAW